MRIVVLGRSANRAYRVASIANARSAILRAPISFVPSHVPEFNQRALSRVVRTYQPKLILVAASLQSPWEAGLARNAWTDLVACGFGITLPFQLSIAAAASRVASDTGIPLINACYPDAVNVVLTRLKHGPTCGVGNAAIVEALCRLKTAKSADDIKVIGHHGHLAGWLNGASDKTHPRIWWRGQEQNALRWRPNFGGAEKLGEELNQVTAATAVAVLMALLTGQTLRASIPGVNGLPGGYPFLLREGKFKMELPADITLGEARNHNRSGERLDGLDLSSGIRFAGEICQKLMKNQFPYAEGFAIEDWEKALDELLRLRDRLRQKPARPVGAKTAAN